MELADVKLHMVLEREEKAWDDDQLEKVQYRVEDTSQGRLHLVRRTEYGSYINGAPIEDYDLSQFKVVGS